MPKLTIYNQKGEVVGKINLNPAVFDVPDKPDLVHRAVVYQMAVERQFNADTKTRGEVRGGGRKPWRQKGTGRARAGSIRSPLWRGGGVVFGPQAGKKTSIKMPKKMRRLALLSALSNKLRTNGIVLLDKIELKKIKTKLVEEMLNKLPIKEGTVLMLLPRLDPKIELSCRNLPYLKTQLTDSLSIIDILKYDYLLLTKDAIKKIEERFLNQSSVLNDENTNLTEESK
uniref:Large ribosomal subunit protein uL4 n=1 Tax=candidate division CPR3 bacterium TaxID=2268181 RepID=A0A7V3J9R5_UNCC3